MTLVGRVVAVAVVASALVLAPPVRSAPATSTAPCSDRSWQGGTTEWCEGSFVYRDYVYDDNGADTAPGSPHGAPLDPATGDVDHREHGQALNSADLLTLRLRARDGGLDVRFELNTLFPGDGTVGVLAIDVDNDNDTGGSTIPGFGVAAPGIDVVHVFEQRDPDPDASFGGLIEGVVPMPPAPAGEWDLYAFTALHDGTVMNVAFRPRESGGWWEAVQGAELASGSIARFKGELTPADLVKGTRHRRASPGEGLQERVYESAFAIGDAQEGVDYDRAVTGRSSSAGVLGQSFAYLGRHQPYAVYVPFLTEPPYGLQLALHAEHVAHTSLVDGDGMQRTFGEALDRIIVVPLGRGPFGYYSDWSERDVLDAMADVRSTYRIDPDRVFAGGHAMGGYGAYRLAALHPDVFAGLTAWAGSTGDCLNGTPVGVVDRCPTGAVGTVLEHFENLRHVPSAHLFAAADELVPAHTANAVRDRLASLGYRHVLWLHAADHVTLTALDAWTKEAAWSADLRRVRAPARVTFRTNPSLGNALLGIAHDRAYWVSGIRAMHEGDVVVDLVSGACGPDRTTTLTNGAGIDPVPWISQEAVETGPTTSGASASMGGRLTNVRELTLDVASPCFASDLSRVATDTATTVRFSDGRQPVTLTP